MSAKPIHLYSNQCHDESEVWCTDPMDSTAWMSDETTSQPHLATCERCLIAAEQYGDACTMRRAELALPPGTDVTKLEPWT